MFIALLLVCCCTTFRAVRRNANDVRPLQISVSYESAQGILNQWDATTNNTGNNNTNRWTSNTTHNDSNRWLRPGADVDCGGCVIRASTEVDVGSDSQGNHVQGSVDKAAVRVSFNPSALHESRSGTHFQNREAFLDLIIILNIAKMGICAVFSVFLVCQFVRSNSEAIDSNGLLNPFEASGDGEESPRNPSEVFASSRTKSPSHTYEPVVTDSSEPKHVSDDDDSDLDALGQEHPPELGSNVGKGEKGAT